MRKLVLFAVPFGFAALLFVYLLSALAGLILGGAAVVCCVIVTRLRLKKKQAFAIIAAGLAVGFLWSAGYELLFLQPIWAVDGTKTEIEATVCDDPVMTDTGCRIKTEIKVNDRTAKTQLYLYGEVPDAAPGDTLRLTAKLSKTEPEQEDGSDYYSISSGIVLRASGAEAEVIKCEKTPLRFLPTVFAKQLRTAIDAAVPEDAAGFLQALVTGNKSGMDEQTKNQFSDAGISHIIAVSGMHVSILLGVIYFLTRKTPLLSALLGIPVILFFIVMTGGSPSIVRAGIMQTIILLAPLLRREADGPTSVCAAMLVILLGNPYAAASVSFQLSFGAIAGIFLCAGKIYAYLTSPAWVASLLKCKGIKPIVLFVLSCISTSLGALLFTMPLTALHFGSVSLYSLPANLLVLGVVSFCFAGGLLAGLLGLIWLPGAQALGWVLAWPVRYILLVAKWISVLPFASLSASSPYVAGWLIFTYLLIIASACLREEKQVFLTGACILAGLGVALIYAGADTSFSVFSITALDVGQGECICMRTNDFSAMVDCGGSSGEAAASAAAEYLGLTTGGQLDYLILTHYDSDHVNGAESLLSRAEIHTLYLPDVADESGNRQNIEQAAKENGTAVAYVTQDISLEQNETRLQIFAPVSYYDDNAACLSVLFSAAEYDMLLTGDMDFFSEYDLLLTHDLPDVELYIAGHHGSATSSSADLLAQIKPETVLVSVGKNNRYGHPTQEALDRFAAVGADIYRTDLCGTVTISD